MNTPAHNSANAVFELIAEQKIEQVDFRFTDSLGKFHHITYKASNLTKEVLQAGIGFDGSSISGWKDINESDMLLKPDLTSYFVDPFTAQSCLIIFCNVIDPLTHEGYSRDPRTVAQKAEQYVKTSGAGDVAYFGPELEFFIFDDVKFKNDPNHSAIKIDSQEGPYNSDTHYPSGNMGHRPEYKGGYFPVQPIDSLFDIRAEICSVLESIGLSVTLHHHEVAASQCEIGFKFSTLTQAADNVQKFKYTVKNVAASYAKTATFMPKPIFGDNGSGMHTHQSIWKSDKPLFYEKGNYADLSELCLYYIGGIIKHAKAINAFTNPTTNSYKRLVPGFEAPVKLAYSSRNRSASIRIPYGEGKNAKRIEVRFPDPLANPYLGFAAMLMAGLDGIKNKIHPGEAIDKNLYELSPKEDSKIPNVARSLREALDALNKDRVFLKQGNVFSDDLIDNYIKLKMEEVYNWETTPHPIEFKMYTAGN